MQGPGAEILCLADLEAHAKAVLDRNAWGHYSGGANHEQTLRDNTEAFARWISVINFIIMQLMMTEIL